MCFSPPLSHTQTRTAGTLHSFLGKLESTVFSNHLNWRDNNAIIFAIMTTTPINETEKSTTFPISVVVVFIIVALSMESTLQAQATIPNWTNNCAVWTARQKCHYSLNEKQTSVLTNVGTRCLPHSLTTQTHVFTVHSHRSTNKRIEYIQNVLCLHSGNYLWLSSPHWERVNASILVARVLKNQC